jgi:hypothetical protein
MKKAILINLFMYALIINLLAQSAEFPFLQDNYQTYSADNKLIALDTSKYNGKRSLKLMDNEIALLKNIEFRNFKLDIDMAGTGMAGIGFRASDLYNYEFIYFRSEESDTGNSIQYVPFYNGSTGWQLYPTSEYQKNADFTIKNWFHVTLEVKENKLKLTINNSPDHSMEVNLLRTDLIEGAILLKSEFTPFYFSNLEIKKLEGTKTVTNNETVANSPLDYWLVSEQFELNEPWLFWSSGSFVQSLKGWQNIQSDRNGLVNLSKYFEYPKDAVAVKTYIKSEMKSTKRLLFDYTHSMAIVLNSEVVFYGKEMDKYGRVYDEEQAIELDLREGENELILIIKGDGELYGDGVLYQGRKQAANWGFTAKIDDYSGITLNQKRQ